MNHFKKLVIRKMALDAVPRGGSIVDGIKFLSDKERIAKAARESTLWVEGAIKSVREAAEPNPFKDSSDEEIAAEILKRIEAREKR